MVGALLPASGSSYVGKFSVVVVFFLCFYLHRICSVNRFVLNDSSHDVIGHACNEIDDIQLTVISRECVLVSGQIVGMKNGENFAEPSSRKRPHSKNSINTAP